MQCLPCDMQHVYCLHLHGVCQQFCLACGVFLYCQQTDGRGDLGWGVQGLLFVDHFGCHSGSCVVPQSCAVQLIMCQRVQLLMRKMCVEACASAMSSLRGVNAVPRVPTTIM